MKVFKDYMDVIDQCNLKGYVVADVLTEINSNATGLLIKMERKISNGAIGIDVCYDPTEEVPLTISQEYIVYVDKEAV